MFHKWENQSSSKHSAFNFWLSSGKEKKKTHILKFKNTTSLFIQAYWLFEGHDNLNKSRVKLPFSHQHLLFVLIPAVLQSSIDSEAIVFLQKQSSPPPLQV